MRISDWSSDVCSSDLVDATISLKVRTGDFIHPPMVLLHVVGADPDGELSAELRGAFAVGAARTPTQDLEYLFDELVEIALRALSPAINDPFRSEERRGGKEWFSTCEYRWSPAL